MIDLIGYKTKNGSVVIEKVQINEKEYKWKLICGRCKKEYLSTKRIITNKEKYGLCCSCTRILSSTTRLNLEGMVFERWTVIIKSDEQDKYGRVLYECVCDCGNIRLVPGTCLNTNNSRSCGCLQKDVARSMCGEFSPHWKNLKKKRIRIVTEEDRKRHKLRKYIYKRDNYKCYICNSSKDLRAHHINGWKWCIEERLEELNLITLCNIHHKNFHKIYGSGENTFKQFEEYSNNFNKNLQEKLEEMKKYKIDVGSKICLLLQV